MTSDIVNDVLRKDTVKRRNRVYPAQVVLWLMINQRLEAPGSLTQAVSLVIRGELEPLARSGEQVSPRTGGYSQARRRMPVDAVAKLTQLLTTGLQQRFPTSHGRSIQLIDGTSVSLGHHPGLVEKYPPAANQHGTSHWPILKMVTMHDAHSGLIVAAAWGPMYGADAVSEQALAARVLEQSPVGGIYLGDRNFGIFATAYQVKQHQSDCILRLTEERARKLLGQDPKVGMDERVDWRPSVWDRKSNPDLPADAHVAGRVIVAQRKGWREPVCLFTTLELVAAEIVRLYRLRWNIETDLRSLKQTVRLERIAVKSDDMLQKELWAAIAAYNLVRAVILEAALYAGVPPRALSFTHVYYLIAASLPALLRMAPDQAQRELEVIIHQAARCKLPNRKRRRSYPRKVWLRRRPYPIRETVAGSLTK